MIMQDGKKELQKKLFMRLYLFHQKKPRKSHSVLEKALQNVGPTVEVKSREGGSNYQVPIEVNSKRKISLAMKWIIEAASKRNEKSMKEKLASEIQMHRKKVQRLKNVRILTKWLKQIKHSHIIGGNSWLERQI